MSSRFNQLPVPRHFNPEAVDEVWRVPYQQLQSRAVEWAEEHNLTPSIEDEFRVALLLIDVQNTFCLPDFELYVAGRSGTGAVDDNKRLATFLYQNLPLVSEVYATMDTHRSAQIFHPFFWVDDEGNHAEPMTVIHADDVESGRWSVNPELARSLEAADSDALEAYARYYTKRLEEDGRMPLTIWPYHAMFSGIGHALVSSIEEACFFHGMARSTETSLVMKGENPLTEHYSALRPEVMEGPDGQPIGHKATELIERLFQFDRVIVAGQAKSHCVAWTMQDIVSEIQARDSALAERFYLLEDCTSPVVIPDVVDFTEQANDAFERCSDAGMHIVTTSTPPEEWPGFSPD